MAVWPRRPIWLISIITAAVLLLLCLVRNSPAAVQRTEASSESAVSLPGLPPGAREPQAALDNDGNVYIAFGAKNAVYCSVSHNGGLSYEAPVKIAEAGSLSLGMRRGPRITVAGKSVIVSAVCATIGGGHDGDLLAWHSKDGGRGWQGPVRINDIPGAAREGLHSMASSPDGKTVACAWLDLRAKGTRIELSLSQDGGSTWSANTLVYASPDGTVCECCHPSLAFGPKGDLYVMWRNVIAGARDMYLARSESGRIFSQARKLGSGTWPLNACPMDGGALAVGQDGHLVTFWRRDQMMFACGGSEESKRSLGKGQQGWAAISTQGTFLTWLVGRPGKLMLLMPWESTPRQIATQANDPVIATSPTQHGPVIVAWTDETENGGIKAARVRVPVDKKEALTFR